MTTPGAIVLLAAAYGLGTLVPRRGDRPRAAILAVIPAVASAWLFGDGSVLGFLGIALCGLLAFAGYLAFDRIDRAGVWVVVQVAAIVALAALPVWLGPAARGLPAEVIAVLILTLGLIVTIEWGGAFVGRAIRPFADRMRAAAPLKDGVVRPRGLPKGFEEGGRTIGRLERLIIFLFVLVSSPAAIGFLVTAKSILRFGEIKDRETQKEAEYIIIGTFMSFGFALVSAYLTRLALQVLLPEAASVLLLL